MSAPLRYFVVDAFTERPFGGNPAAVVPLSTWPTDVWLQDLAMEMNLSETAFLVPSDGRFDLRWFTPKVEVDLCGHATLASACVLAELGQLGDGSEVHFNTRSGVLSARQRSGRFQLDFPVKPAEVAPAPAGLVDAIKVTPRFVGRSKFDYLVEVDSENVVRCVAPDFAALARVECRGVIVTSRSSDGRFDFVSRFFAPAAGVNEDPVTGSAHCTLADHWSTRLGKTKMVAYQASRRGGVVHLELQGNRVLLGGDAVIVASGELRTAPPA